MVVPNMGESDIYINVYAHEQKHQTPNGNHKQKEKNEIQRLNKNYRYLKKINESSKVYM